MKVCYVDESGNQEADPCFVMVGVLVDTARLNRTRQEFSEIFDTVQSLFDENLKELKGSKMIFGRDRWRKIDPEARKSIAGYLCDWVVKRKHKLTLCAIDRAKYAALPHAAFPGLSHDVWMIAGLHVALQVQKANQGEANNKGHTFLVFDENKAKADGLAELLWNPPTWTDDFYNKPPEDERLDQLIDSAFTVKSHHAGLVQVADLYALILRRYAELNEYGCPEEWAGERDLINGYTETLSSRLCARATRWPSKSSSECAKWYVAVAPETLLELGK